MKPFNQFISIIVLILLSAFITYSQDTIEVVDRITDVDIDKNLINNGKEQKMSDLQNLIDRNSQFAEKYEGGLIIMPRFSTIVLTCGDARIDLAHYLGLDLGDVFVFRNAGARGCPDNWSLNLVFCGCWQVKLPETNLKDWGWLSSSTPIVATNA